MQDKHNIVFVLSPFLYAFCFALSGFYIFSLTFCRVLRLLRSFRRVRLQRQTRLISAVFCLIFDLNLKCTPKVFCRILLQRLISH